MLKIRKYTFAMTKTVEEWDIALLDIAQYAGNTVGFKETTHIPGFHGDLHL